MISETNSTEPRRGRDGGYSLPEVLVAVVLTGTIVLAIMTAMHTVILTSVQNDERARIQAIVGGAADRVLNYAWTPCPEVSGTYELIGDAAAPVGWDDSTVSIVDYEYWNSDLGTHGGWDANNSIQGTDCNTGAGRTADKKMQKMTIQVTTPNGNYSTELEIIKTDIRPQEVKDASAP